MIIVFLCSIFFYPSSSFLSSFVSFLFYLFLSDFFLSSFLFFFLAFSLFPFLFFFPFFTSLPLHPSIPPSQFCPLYAPGDAPIGTIISFPGYTSKPSDSPSRAAKAWRQIEKDGSFYVNTEGVACFDPRPKPKRGKSEGGDKEEVEEVVKASLTNDIGVSNAGRDILGKIEKSKSVPFSVYLNDFSSGAGGMKSKGLICTSTVAGRVL